MNKLMIALLISLFSLSLFSGEGGGGSTVGHGGGISENNIIAARDHLGDYYTEMLHSQKLNLSTRESATLGKIKARLSIEIKAKFKFMNSKDFQFNGNIFSTKEQPGSDVYLNLDLLYMKGSNGEKIPFTFGQSVGLITEIFNRNEHDLSALEMKDLRTKIENFFEQAIATLTLNSWGRPNIQITTMNWKGSTEVLMMDSFGLTNVTALINTALPCQSSNKQIIEFYNIYLGPQFATDKNEQRVNYQGSITFSCGAEKLSGQFTLKAFYALSSKSLIDISWWNKDAVAAKLEGQKLNLVFSDIH
jgi:hypothetical protein